MSIVLNYLFFFKDNKWTVVKITKLIEMINIKNTVHEIFSLKTTKKTVLTSKIVGTSLKSRKFFPLQLKLVVRSFFLKYPHPK